jgi:hypothetical protein
MCCFEKFFFTSKRIGKKRTLSNIKLFEVGPEIKISGDNSSCFLVFSFYVFNPEMSEVDSLAFHSGQSSFLII